MITDKSNQSHLPYQGTGRERKGGKEKFTTNVRLGKLSRCSTLSSLDTGHRNAHAVVFDDTGSCV